MLRSKRFEPIRVIVAKAAEDLSRAMGVAGQRVAELELQFGQLETYRDEYVHNAAAGSSGSMSALKLQNYRSFLDRLGEAIRQHWHNLEAARAEYERRRTLWSAKRVEAESLSRVVERFHKEENYESEQREQRVSDEAAMRSRFCVQK